MDRYLSASLSIVNSAALHHKVSAALLNASMKTIEQIRRERLIELKNRFGSWATINELLARPRTDSTLSQYANQAENSRGGSTKAMGSSTARALETACRLEPGWMDSDPDAWPFSRISLSKLRALAPVDLERIEMAVLAAASMSEIDIAERLAA